MRRRIRGVRETAKVTHAMEIVAGARMKRTELRALQARPYAARLSRLIGGLLGELSTRQEHRLLVGRDTPGALVIHMTTDKGLCGALNTRLNHALGSYALEHTDPLKVITVGRKGRDFAVRAGLDLVADFSGLGDAAGMGDLMPLCRLAISTFVSGAVGVVYLSYPVFVTTMQQTPVFEQLLPVDTSSTRGHSTGEYVVEPGADALLEALLVRYVDAQVYHAYLELVASEYSARMVAMHNATDSARELGDDLVLELNKQRQSAVTVEIADVSAGAEALGAGGPGG